MAGFRKAKAEQAALKMCIYGASGTGKTLTSLMIAEGLATHTSKRIAFVDTEHGTDFYCKEVPERSVHPGAFDFDALYERSITNVLKEVKSLNNADYGVIVIDSITHLWEAAKNSYTGKKTSTGGIPMHAWGPIKKPYKDLMQHFLNCPQHVIICGRQGNDWSDEDGELKNLGVKMKAEGETTYEPHILLRTEVHRTEKRKGQVPEPHHVIIVEKDRTGMLPKIIEWPTFDNTAKPLLGLLGGEQARIASDDEIATLDSEAINRAEREKIRQSAEFVKTFRAKMDLAANAAELDKISKEITPAIKATMTPGDVGLLREYYLEAASKYPRQ